MIVPPTYLLKTIKDGVKRKGPTQQVAGPELVKRIALVPITSELTYDSIVAEPSTLAWWSWVLVELEQVAPTYNTETGIILTPDYYGFPYAGQIIANWND